MAKFSSPTAEVLYRLSLDGTAEPVGYVSTWGEIHLGLGEVTRNELIEHHHELLSDAGITADAFPVSAFWIVHEDGQGFVDVSVFEDETTYRSTLDYFENRWAEFDAAS